MLKLVMRCSHLTVVRVLRRHRLGPAPRRRQRSWRSFVRQHADQMLACDFFLVDTIWMTQLYVFSFVEVGSRCVHLAGCTYNPSAEWVVQQARNLAWRLQDGALSAKFLLRDRDSKFTAAFHEVFRSEGVRVVRLRVRAPRANSIAERVRRHSTAGVPGSPPDLRPRTSGAGTVCVPRALPSRSTASRA